MRKYAILGLYVTSATTLIIGCGGGGGSSSAPPSALDLSLASALSAKSGGIGASYFTLPESTDYARIPQDPKNRITSAKVALGRMIYHDSYFGQDSKRADSKGTYACASCHFAEGGFSSNRPQALSDGGWGFANFGKDRTFNPLFALSDIDSPTIKSPSILNCAYQKNQLWNGQFGATGVNIDTHANWTPGTAKDKNNLGYEGVETQAIAAQDVHRLKFNELLITGAGYKGMFDAAFGDWPVYQRYSQVTAGLAIAAYERTVLANRSPWQVYLRGDRAALTDSMKRGALLFFGKADCVRCHTGPALNTMEFHGLGLKDLYQHPGVINTNAGSPENLGRGGFTGNAADNYKFKVPQLYNTAQAPYLGHGASIHDVRDFIEYLNTGVAENGAVPGSQVDLLPLGLTSDEMDDLAAFVEQGLFDPNVLRYKPASVLSGSAMPVNDRQARIDILGHP